MKKIVVKIAAAAVAAVVLAGCVDGRSGDVYLCPSEKCRVGK